MRGGPRVPIGGVILCVKTMQSFCALMVTPMSAKTRLSS